MKDVDVPVILDPPMSDLSWGDRGTVGPPTRKSDIAKDQRQHIMH